MQVGVVVPNWNNEDIIESCVDALLSQDSKIKIIIVDNGSVDNSLKILEQYKNQIVLLKNPKNYGFAGGVNTGIRYALQHNFDYIALLNSDAVADPKWAGELVKILKDRPDVGIATSRMLKSDGKTIDTTADIYTNWLVHFPRSRDLPAKSRDMKVEEVFGATGGGSMYRATMLQEIGLFDEDFFAYYEDVDISFRAQLVGWKIVYTPQAVAYHAVGGTSSKIKGFTTYQTLKNTPMVWFKNLPLSMWPSRVPRYYILYSGFIVKALLRGQFKEVVKSQLVLFYLLPKKIKERLRIQSSRKVSTAYLKQIIYPGLPPRKKTG